MSNYRQDLPQLSGELYLTEEKSPPRYPANSPYAGSTKADMNRSSCSFSPY